MTPRNKVLLAHLRLAEARSDLDMIDQSHWWPGPTDVHAFQVAREAAWQRYLLLRQHLALAGAKVKVDDPDLVECADLARTWDFVPSTEAK